MSSGAVLVASDMERYLPKRIVAEKSTAECLFSAATKQISKVLISDLVHSLDQVRSWVTV